MTTRIRFSTVEEYVSKLPEDVVKTFKKLRLTIKDVVPNGVESFSYQIPVIKLNGKFVVYYAGWKNHISLYPVPSGTKIFEKQIAPYVAGKGTLKFDIDKPIPYDLISSIVKNSLKQNLIRTKKQV